MTKNKSDSQPHENQEPVEDGNVVQSVTHEHQWVLVSSDDGFRKRRPLPEGQWVSRGGLFGGARYIPGFDERTLRESILEVIIQADQPRFSSETWACPCGERKTNTHRHPGMMELLKGVKVDETLPRHNATSTAKGNDVKSGDTN